MFPDADGTMKPRQTAASFAFDGPYSFRAFLAEHLKLVDFQDANGRWFDADADRGYVLRMVELSGDDHTCVIHESLSVSDARSTSKRDVASGDVLKGLIDVSRDHYLLSQTEAPAAATLSRLTSSKPIRNHDAVNICCGSVPCVEPQWNVTEVVSDPNDHFVVVKSEGALSAFASSSSPLKLDNVQEWKSTILDKSKIVEGRDGGAFVCVTGQTSRLEIESKVRSVLHPLAERFSYVDLAFVLDSTSSHFSILSGDRPASRYDSPDSVRSVPSA